MKRIKNLKPTELNTKSAKRLKSGEEIFAEAYDKIIVINGGADKYLSLSDQLNVDLKLAIDEILNQTSNRHYDIVKLCEWTHMLISEVNTEKKRELILLLDFVELILSPIPALFDALQFLNFPHALSISISAFLLCLSCTPALNIQLLNLLSAPQLLSLVKNSIKFPLLECCSTSSIIPSANQNISPDNILQENSNFKKKISSTNESLLKSAGSSDSLRSSSGLIGLKLLRRPNSTSEISSSDHFPFTSQSVRSQSSYDVSKTVSRLLNHASRLHTSPVLDGEISVLLLSSFSVLSSPSSTETQASFCEQLLAETPSIICLCLCMKLLCNITSRANNHFGERPISFAAGDSQLVQRSTLARTLLLGLFDKFDEGMTVLTRPVNSSVPLRTGETALSACMSALCIRSLEVLTDTCSFIKESVTQNSIHLKKSTSTSSVSGFKLVFCGNLLLKELEKVSCLFPSDHDDDASSSAEDDNDEFRHMWLHLLNKPLVAYLSHSSELLAQSHDCEVIQSSKSALNLLFSLSNQCLSLFNSICRNWKRWSTKSTISLTDDCVIIDWSDNGGHEVSVEDEKEKKRIRRQEMKNFVEIDRNFMVHPIIVNIFRFVHFFNVKRRLTTVVENSSSNSPSSIKFETNLDDDYSCHQRLLMNAYNCISSFCFHLDVQQVECIVSSANKTILAESCIRLDGSLLENGMREGTIVADENLHLLQCKTLMEVLIFEFTCSFSELQRTKKQMNLYLPNDHFICQDHNREPICRTSSAVSTSASSPASEKNKSPTQSSLDSITSPEFIDSAALESLISTATNFQILSATVGVLIGSLLVKIKGSSKINLSVDALREMTGNLLIVMSEQIMLNVQLNSLSGILLEQWKEIMEGLKLFLS